MSHYGKDETGHTLSSADAWGIASDVISTADACIMVVDLLDFEGTFMPELARMARGSLLIAVNKADLLPSKTPVDEVSQWVADRLKQENIVVDGIFPVSAMTGYGCRVLFEAVKKKAGRGARVSLVGATNVGKSTLLGRWLKNQSSPAPTVSEFPGTTVGAVERDIGRGELVIVDTPGIATQGRLSELFCQSCNAKLVPGKPITSKLIRFLPGQSVILGGIASVTPLDSIEERIALLFASGAVVARKVKASRENGPGRMPRAAASDVLCSQCRAAVDRVGREEIVIEVEEMQDIAIHGLGWLSPRRGPLKVRVSLPAGAMVTVRPRLIGPKTPYRPRVASHPKPFSATTLLEEGRS